MANDHLPELDELQKLLGENLEPSNDSKESDKYAKLAVSLARSKKWQIVRDFMLFELELTEPDRMMRALAAAQISPEEVGQRMLIAYEVNVHLTRILNNIEGLVAKGVAKQQEMADAQDN